MRGLRREVMSGAFWISVSRVLSVPIRVFTSIIMIRCLSREDYGTYSFVLTISGTLLYVVSIGIQHAVARYVPEFIERREYGVIIRFTGWLTGVRLAVVLLSLAVLWACWGPFAEFFHFPASLAACVPLVVLVILLQRTSEVFGQYFHCAMLDMRTVTIHDTLRPLVFIAGIGAAYQRGLHMSDILAVLLLTEACSALYFGVSFLRHRSRLHRMQGQLHHGPALLEWRRIWRFAGYNALYTIGGIIVGTSMDTLIVARYFGMKEVALYSFGVGLIMSVHSLNPISMYKNVLSNVSVRRYYQSGDSKDLLFGSQLTSKIGLFFGLPIAASVCVLARPLIEILYKSEYIPAIPIMYVFAVMICSRVFQAGLSIIINALELVKFLMLLNLLTFYNIGMALVLAPRIGIIGVALATCSTELIWCFILWLVVRCQGIKGAVFSTSQIPIVLNTILLVGVLYAVRGRIEGLLSLMLAVVAGAGLYLACSYLVKPFTQNERNLINGVLPRPMWVF